MVFLFGIYSKALKS